MSEQLTIGQSLTYEQAMALPDCAVVSAIWGDDGLRTYCTVGSNNSLSVPKKFGGASLEHEDYWNYDQWHSVRLESLPELPVWVITCDRCGTTYKNNERHACDDREPAKPERQAGEIEKEAALIALGPLFEDCHDAMRDAMDERDYDYLYDFWTNVEGAFRRYREMYDYAKSIGAI